MNQADLAGLMTAEATPLLAELLANPVARGQQGRLLRKLAAMGPAARAAIAALQDLLKNASKREDLIEQLNQTLKAIGS